jgi:hypothetical protein
MTKSSNPKSSHRSLPDYRNASTPADQQSLFTASELSRYTQVRYGGVQTGSGLDADTIQAWKERVMAYQHQVREAPAQQQVSLFDWAGDLGGGTDGPRAAADIDRFSIDSSSIDPASIDPFSLELSNFHFFSQPAASFPDSPCLYFVIDLSYQIVLYVGETCRLNQRWKGVHDCKRYVLNYQAAHLRHQLPTAVNTAFWWDTPQDTRQRQTMESELIRQWRSPFNKENWEFWGTPFIGEK